MLTRSFMFWLGLLTLGAMLPLAYAADIDRTAVDFKTPSEIKWVRNAAGANESAVLFGDPSKPGPDVVIIQVRGMGPTTSTPAEKR